MLDVLLRNKKRNEWIGQKMKVTDIIQTNPISNGITIKINYIQLVF